MSVGLGARVAGLLLPTKQIASRLFGKSFDKFVKSRLSNTLVDTADTGLNYAATVAPLDAMTNAAEIIKLLKERGFTDEEISRLMLGSMAEELPTDLPENFITSNVILGKGFGLRGKTWKGRLGYGSLNIPLEMGGEYSHKNGWKFDLHDGGFGAEGALITDDYQKGTLADEFMEYWQARGVGVNLEGVGTPNVHFDISTAGYQWKDNDGNDLAKPFYRSGFNAKGTASSERENIFDPNFTERQNQIWQAAQYAAQHARDKYGINIPPELIYKQRAHEAGANFDSENAIHNNNFGGLTQTEPNGEENKQPDGDNYYRHFNNVQEYADVYVDDFIGHRPELNGVKTVREFAQVMKDTGYYGDSVENYTAGMEGVQVPKSGFRGGASASDDTSIEESNDPDSIYQRIISNILNEETKPIFDATGDDFITLSSMFGDKGEFINSKANRNKLAELYGDELAEFGQAALDERLAQLAEKNSSVERSFKFVSMTAGGAKSIM